MPFGPAIAAAGTVIGGVITSQANKDAASTAAQGQTDAARITTEANDRALDKQLAFSKEGRDELRAASGRGLGYIDKGVADYTSTVDPLLNEAPVTLPTYRGLTARQQTAEGDLLRNADAQLAASGLRGAGRAGIGQILDQDRRFQENAAGADDASTLTAKQTSQARADSARTGIAGVKAAAGGAKANTELQTGNSLANNLSGAGSASASLISASGQAGANAAANAAGYEAQASAANSKILSSSIGSLAGIASSPYNFSGNPNLGPGIGGGSDGSYVDSGTFV